MYANEFMFFSSQRVRSSSSPTSRTEMFASQRSVPFSISASEMPSSTIVWRSSWRKRRASSADRKSGCVTISTSGVPPRLKSTSERPAPTIRPPALRREPSSPRPPRGVRGRRRSRAGRPRRARQTSRSRTAARRTARSGSPSGGRSRSSSCGGRPRAAAMSQPSARPSLTVHSTAVRFGDGQGAGVRKTDGARPRVLGRAEPRRAAAEHLRPGLQLDMDLQPDDGLPAHRSRSGTPSNASACSSAWPARKRRFSAN